MDGELRKALDDYRGELGYETGFGQKGVLGSLQDGMLDFIYLCFSFPREGAF